MIKRTIYFGNPAYLSLTMKQLKIEFPKNERPTQTIPIEDIGVVILDNRQLTITQALIDAMLQNNVALISCDGTHHPTGLMLPLDVNTLQSERFRYQIAASLPLKKQLWQQTVQAKILNQAAVLSKCRCIETRNMQIWSRDVRSGDVGNMEARAAQYYWRNLFPQVKDFVRDRYGDPPNNLLNYGYAILRAIVARSLVASGLLPTLGIHHHNRYNSYCLADDIMEPYRPYIDNLVVDIFDNHKPDDNLFSLDNSLKTKMLSVPVIDVQIAGTRSPLMTAVATTTTSLYKCFKGESRRIIYPIFSRE